MKLSRSEWKDLKLKLVLNADETAYIYDGHEVYLYDGIDVSYMLGYLIQKEYHAISIELDFDDEDTNFSQLSRIGIFEESARTPVEQALTNRILIVDYAKYAKCADFMEQLTSDVIDTYKSILGGGYTEEIGQDYMPKYVYFEGLAKSEEFATLEEKIAYNGAPIIPLYKNILGNKRIRKQMAQSFERVQAKFGKTMLISSERNIRSKDQGLFEECRRLYYDMKLSLCQTICVDVDTEVNDAMMATFAALAASTDKRVIFTNGGDDGLLADKLLELTSGRLGTIYDRIRRSISLGAPGSLRLVVKQGLDSLDLCRINGVKETLHFTACRFSDIEKSLLKTSAGWSIDPSVSTLDKVEVLSEENINLFETDDEGNFLYALKDPLELVKADTIDEAENKWHYICRLIDQFCTNYRNFTTLHDVIAMLINGEVYVGYADYKASYLSDLFVLDEEGNYIRDLEVGDIIDSRFLYDMKDTEGNYNEDFLIKISQIMQNYGIDKDIVDVPDARVSVDDALNYIWYYTSAKSTQNVEIADSIRRRLFMNSNYRCYAYYLRTLFKIVTPYGFREISYKDCIVNVFGGVKPGLSDVYPDFFKHVPEM